MERQAYIDMVFRDHLSDATTYRELTKQEAEAKVAETKFDLA